MTETIQGKIKASFPGIGKNGNEKPERSYGLGALYRKEMADHIRSKRFLIVLFLILLTSCASIYGALSSLSDAVASDSNYIFLKLFTLSGNSIPSFTSFIALLGPFVGLTLGFDAINSERSEGTLNRLVAQPIYRDAVINGKFLAGAAIIFLMVFSMGLIIGAVGLLFSGILPTSEEVGRVAVFLFFTAIYICFWLALSIFFSVICRHAATSAMAVIALWIFFALFMSLVVSIVTDVIYPASQIQTAGQLLDNSAKYTPEGGRTQVILERISRNSVRLWVNSQGKPIPSETKERIFCRYYRAEEAAGRKGCGLGLSIAGDIIHFHGGRAGVEYKDGMNCFYVILKTRQGEIRKTWESLYKAQKSCV